MAAKVKILVEADISSNVDEIPAKVIPKSVEGYRATFCANRFFSVSSPQEINDLSLSVVQKAVELGIDIVLVEPEIEQYFKFPTNINYSTEFSTNYEFSTNSDFPTKIAVLYKDAVKGMPLAGYYLEQGVEVYSWMDLISERGGELPKHAWTVTEKNIYPIDLPPVNFDKNIDMILMDCPSRNLSMMPNGLGYVANSIKKTGINYQVYDLDIVAYHRFHIDRIYNQGGKQNLPSGKILPKDPWQAENYDVWGEKEMAEYMFPFISDVIDAIVEAKPKILGMSIQQCNTNISAMVAKVVKARSPETIILVGGFSCYNATIGFKSFPLADYMCIGEADLTVGTLVKRLAGGEIVKNMPGVLSKFDDSDKQFIPAPMENNLDKLEDPRYEWFSLSVYRNWDG